MSRPDLEIPILEMERIASKYSKSKTPTFQHITRGFDNHVLIIEDQIVLKFPHNKAQNKRDLLESDMLNYLEDLNPPVSIPVFLTAGDHPSYYAYNRLPGDILTIEQIKNFSKTEVDTLAKSWASFISWFGRSMSIERFSKMLKSDNTKPEENYEQRFKKTLGDFNNQNYPSLTEVSKELYPKLLRIYPHDLKNITERVIHNDLHPDNLLFVSNKLSAVLDFGDVCLGTVNEELKETTYIGEQFMRLVVKELNKMGEPSIDPEEVLLWSQINKIASLIHRVNDKTKYSFEDSKKILEQWFPDKNWGEL